MRILKFASNYTEDETKCWKMDFIMLNILPITSYISSHQMTETCPMCFPALRSQSSGEVSVKNLETRADLEEVSHL